MQRRLFISAFIATTLVACAPLQQSHTPKTIDITANGKTVTVPVKPQRVAVFDPASVDTLDAMGVRVAGVTTMALPEHLSYYQDAKYVKIGTLFEPDMKALTEMKPDLIIVSGRSRAKAEELSKLAPVLDLSHDTANFANTTFANWANLGKIYGREAKAAELISKTKSEIARIRAVAPQKGTALQVMTIKDNIMAFGPQSRFGFIHDVLGFKPAFIAPALPQGITAAEARKLRPTANDLAASNPEWIFTFDRGAIGKPDNAAPALTARAEFANTPAVKNNHVVKMNEVTWYIYGPAGYSSFNSALKDVATALDIK